MGLHLLRSRASADLERQVESRTRDAVAGRHRRRTHRGQRARSATDGAGVIAVQAFIGTERDTALLLAFRRATTGFGWSRPGRSALVSNTVPTLLPGEGCRRSRAGSPAFNRGCRTGAGIGRHQRTTGWPTSSRRGVRPTRCLLHEVSPVDARLRPTTSRGTTSCCSGCAPPHLRDAPQPPDRWPSCAATTTPTRPVRCKRCVRGWKPEGPGGGGQPAEECTRTPCDTDCARWPTSPPCSWTSAKKRLAMMIELAATDYATDRRLRDAGRTWLVGTPQLGIARLSGLRKRVRASGAPPWINRPVRSRAAGCPGRQGGASPPARPDDNQPSAEGNAGNDYRRTSLDDLQRHICDCRCGTAAYVCMTVSTGLTAKPHRRAFGATGTYPPDSRSAVNAVIGEGSARRRRRRTGDGTDSPLRRHRRRRNVSARCAGC